MNEKDVKSISYKTAFNKKWWESRRSSKVKKSGVGDALDRWQKNCHPKIDKMTPKEVEEAKITCQSLTKALKSAIGKCGKLQKDTKQGCEKYVKLVEDYEKKVDNHLVAINQNTRDVRLALEQVQALLPKATKEVQAIQTSVAKSLAAFGKLKKEVDRLGNLTDEKTRTKKEKELGDAFTKALMELEQTTTRKLTKANESVDTVLSSLEEKIAIARLDPQFRTAIAQHKKTVDTYEKLYDEVFEELQSVKTDFTAYYQRMGAMEKSQDAIKLMKKYRGYVVENPFRPELQSTLDDLKKNAKTIHGFSQDTGAMTERQWVQVDDIDDNAKGALQTMKQLNDINARTLKMATPLVKLWKQEKIIKTWMGEMSEAIKSDKKIVDQIFQLAPAVRKEIGKLLKERK